MATSTGEQVRTYYQILQVPPDSTTADIRKAYLKLIKLSHPDKNLFYEKTTQTQQHSFAQSVIEAYGVLVDQNKRKAYDHHLKLEKENSDNRIQCGSKAHQPIISQILDLSEFTQLSPSSRHINDQGVDKYVYPCRCGGEFMITSQDMDIEKNIVGCNGCSLTVKVEFELDSGDSLCDA